MTSGADDIFVRELHPGMGLAVAERTILRKKEDGTFETWRDVAHRVALGNSLLARSKAEQKSEYEILRRHIAKGSLLMSGRHLQHGDENQPTKNIEIFTNCATAASNFVHFYLLLNGTGVGRCVDDDMILVDWDNAPNLRCVLSDKHPDFDHSAHETVRDALHKYGPDSKNVMWFKVPDTREGWAQALELWEVAAFEKINHDHMIILDFSDIRPKGTPIKGMQNKPASGPVPLMNAFVKAASLKGSGLAPWRQAIYVGHYFAECVLVAGARRAAGMITKFWKDKDIVEFVRIKRPIEFDKLSMEEIVAFRKTDKALSFLWSSNHSVTVDDEFWSLIDLKRDDEAYGSDLAKHARKVLKEITMCSYGDGTGEPGIINIDKLNRNSEGIETLVNRSYVGSKKYQIREDTDVYLSRLAKRTRKKKYPFIVNPCGEIVLHALGGYCVIADVVPFHCDTLVEAEFAFRAAVRALIRVNQMDCLYRVETDRTNRIGIGMTGVHEFAWKFFEVGFKDLINPDFDYYRSQTELYQDLRAIRGIDASEDAQKVIEDAKKNPAYRAAAFWLTLQRFNAVIKAEAKSYYDLFGMKTPHTSLTIKPAGTTSKLFGLTEGWHLPAMEFYLRWVQFRSDDPLVKKYKKAGYPVRELTSYRDTAIVGFPTAPTIASLGMGDKLVLAGDATPEEQYTWLMLGEKYWLKGEGEDRGNQISYTLKYDPKKVDYKHFVEMLRKYQKQVKCCSVMPQEDTSSYEYLPEERISREEFDAMNAKIKTVMVEDISREHIDCDSGSCPVDFKEKK